MQNVSQHEYYREVRDSVSNCFLRKEGLRKAFLQDICFIFNELGKNSPMEVVLKPKNLISHSSYFSLHS